MSALNDKVLDEMQLEVQKWTASLVCDNAILKLRLGEAIEKIASLEDKLKIAEAKNNPAACLGKRSCLNINQHLATEVQQ